MHPPTLWLQMVPKHTHKNPNGYDLTHRTLGLHTCCFSWLKSPVWTHRWMGITVIQINNISMECEYLLLKKLLLCYKCIVFSCFIIGFFPLHMTENMKSAFTKEQVGRPQLSNTHFQDRECVEDTQVFISVLFLSYHSMIRWCLFSLLSLFSCWIVVFSLFFSLSSLNFVFLISLKLIHLLQDVINTND